MPKKKAAKPPQSGSGKAKVKKIPLGNTSRKSRNAKRTMTRPEFIDEDIWPGSEAFGSNEKNVIGFLYLLII